MHRNGGKRGEGNETKKPGFPIRIDHGDIMYNRQVRDKRAGLTDRQVVARATLSRQAKHKNVRQTARSQMLIDHRFPSPSLLPPPSSGRTCLVRDV